MKNRSKKALCMILAGITAALCACQANSEKNVVTSKNDGSFNANAAVSATEHHDPDATQDVQYSDIFSSTDGSVEFRVSIDETVTAADMPVIEVVPHYPTEEEVQRVARILFGDAEFYEMEYGLI